MSLVERQKESKEWKQRKTVDAMAEHPRGFMEHSQEIMVDLTYRIFATSFIMMMMMMMMN